MPPKNVRRRIALACIVGLALLLAGLAGAHAWQARIVWRSRYDVAEADANRRADTILRHKYGGLAGSIERRRLEADYWAWLRSSYLFEPSPLPTRDAIERRSLREPGLRRRH